MFAYISQFFEICQFRRNPQDLPSSQAVKFLVLGIYIVVGVFVSSLNVDFSTTLLTIAVDTILLLSLAHVSLWITGLSHRVNQTVIALAGTGSIFTLISVPILLLMRDIPEGQSSPINILLIPLLFWYIAVIGHIMKNALNMPPWAGLSIGIIYYIISYRILRLIVTASTGTG